MTRPDRPPGRDMKGGPPVAPPKDRPTIALKPPAPQRVAACNSTAAADIRAGGAAAVAAVMTLIDPAAETEYRRQICRETWRDAYRRGWKTGYEAGARVFSGEWPAVVKPVLRDPPVRRWHVCCRQCRQVGHRPGCDRCQDGDRGTYGQRHPDDYPGDRRAGGDR